MRRNIILFGLAILLSVVQADQSFAQYFGFGKNRVQYDEFEWRFIQSEHFDIYYYDAKNYELAEFTAFSLESSLKQLNEDFDHEIVDRIRVIIYDSHNDFSQTNVIALPIDAEGIGGVTDKLKNRITLPFDGDYNDFRRTLQHELVHAVFNDMFYGGTIQSIIANNIQLVFPLWFEEGLAEYMALGWDSNTDMFIRDAVINGYLPPIPQLGGYYAYRGGQSMWNFIAEEYGREKISEILNRIKITRNIQAGFVQSLGLTVSELSVQWQDALRKRYFPEVAEREETRNVATLLTTRQNFGPYNTSPAISPQGDKVAMITNDSGVFNVSVISSITGDRLKTLTNGNSDTGFEELNILNPNLTWSPDGKQIALSAKSKGKDDIAIIDYQSGKVTRLKFNNLDAIGSVSWSPDGSKLAFDANIGPYQDIFVYEFGTGKFQNVTMDFFSDTEPTWSSDSNTIFFTSTRGQNVEINRYAYEYKQLKFNDLYSTDIYSIKVGDSRAVQLTKTPEWSEFRPQVTRTGRMVFISDKNGIQNVYEFNLENRLVTPLTNLQSGVMQISISADGSRLALNSINRGYVDIFLMKSPFTRAKEEDPTPNYWAQRRAKESNDVRVPAIQYVKQMYAERSAEGFTVEETVTDKPEEEVQEEKTDESLEDGVLDFRNYVFAEEVMADTTIELENLDLFKPEANVTDDGRYQPRKYRLSFSPDISFAGGSFSTGFGSFALTQLVFSDLLGDHQLSFGSNLQFDLRNSVYSIQYGYLKNRTNYYANFFHFAQSFQTFSGELFRFRNYGGGFSVQYPLNKFQRVDFSMNAVGIVRDVSSLFPGSFDNTAEPGEQAPTPGFNPRETSAFIYPQFIFTSDKTLPGYITPRKGTRYSLSLSGSPGVIGDSQSFGSILGDWRHYFDMGYGYTFALRGSGAASLGPGKQTYFLGGQLGWINQRFASNNLPVERLADNFFTLPALPMRGYAFNVINGSQFSLINAEFRFPLFAAILPGPIPIIPLYNLTGVAFIDAGTAWGLDIDYQLRDSGGNAIINDAGLDFRVAESRTGNFVDLNGSPGQEQYYDGDVFIGAGFGLRTILLGLPFRWEMGWPYERSGFQGGPIHYFSIGIDF